MYEIIKTIVTPSGKKISTLPKKYETSAEANKALDLIARRYSVRRDGRKVASHQRFRTATWQARQVKETAMAGGKSAAPTRTKTYIGNLDVKFHYESQSSSMYRIQPVHVFAPHTAEQLMELVKHTIESETMYGHASAVLDGIGDFISAGPHVDRRVAKRAGRRAGPKPVTAPRTFGKSGGRRPR